MSIFDKLPRNIAYATFLSSCCLLLSFFGGCGGETRGTGVRSLEGTVADADGNPLANAAVILSDMPDINALTDSNGHFDFDVPADSGPELLNVAVQLAGQAPVLGATIIPAGSSTITLALTVNSSAQSLQINIVAVATATASPSLPSTATPLPQASPIIPPSGAATATPGVMPSATATSGLGVVPSMTPTSSGPITNPPTNTPTHTPTPTRTPCAAVIC